GGEGVIEAAGGGGGRELGMHPAAGGLGAGLVEGAGEGGMDGSGQRVGVERGGFGGEHGEQAGLAGEGVAGGDDGDAGQDGFEHGQGQAFPARGADGQIAGGQHAGDIGVKAGQQDATAEAVLGNGGFERGAIGPLAQDQEPGFGVARQHLGSGRHQQIEALLPGQAADGGEQAASG